MPRKRHLEIARRHRAERAARFGRIKRWLKPLPRRSNLARYPVIRHFAAAARSYPQIWSFQRSPVRRAIYLGSLIAFLPAYGLHLLMALGAAIVMRANLAVTCAFVFITNPVTAGPVYYGAYRVGMRLIETLGIGEGQDALGTHLNALFLGGLVLGLAVAVVADLAYLFGAWETARLRERHARARKEAEAAGVDPEDDTSVDT